MITYYQIVNTTHNNNTTEREESVWPTLIIKSVFTATGCERLAMDETDEGLNLVVTRCPNGVHGTPEFGANSMAVVGLSSLVTD